MRPWEASATSLVQDGGPEDSLRAPFSLDDPDLGSVVAAAEAEAAAREGAALVRSLGARAVACPALGAAEHVLVAVTSDASYDLLVVGHRGHSVFREMILGSVAKRVAAHAACPVLLTRGPAPRVVKHVLAAIDGSAPARRALESAAALARDCGARMTLLHVVDTALLTAPTHPALMARLHVDQEEAGRVELTWAAEACRRVGMAPGMVELVQRKGRPAETILALAAERGAQIVAIGRPNMPGRLVLGRDSDAVLSGSRGGVLIAGEKVGARAEADNAGLARPAPDPLHALKAVAGRGGRLDGR